MAMDRFVDSDISPGATRLSCRYSLFRASRLLSAIVRDLSFSASPFASRRGTWRSRNVDHWSLVTLMAHSLVAEISKELVAIQRGRLERWAAISGGDSRPSAAHPHQVRFG